MAYDKAILSYLLLFLKFITYVHPLNSIHATVA